MATKAKPLPFLTSRAHKPGPTQQGSQSGVRRAPTWKKKWHFFLTGLLSFARNPAQTSCSTVQKKWKKRLKKKYGIEVQSQLLQMETHQTTSFCTSKQIPVISECSLSIPFKGSGIPGYRDFYPIKETETFFSLTWEHIQYHLCNR